MDKQPTSLIDLDALWRALVLKHTKGGACNFRDAAFEFSSLQTVTKWQPIETAPKDGTDIVICFDCASVLVAHIAWWRGKEDAPDFSEEDEGWWSYVKGSVSQELLDGYRTPTHWIPMPSFLSSR